jgi:hypothetical protein
LSKKSLLTMTALIELGAGSALVFFPSAMVTLLVGAPLETPAALTVARVGGAGLFSLGIACWLARGDANSNAAWGLIAALSLYDLAASAILAFAGVDYGMHGAALWPAVALHAAMTVWCIVSLRSSHPVVISTLHTH